MSAATGSVSFQEVTNSTGRVFRIGETPRDVLGYGRWVPIMAAWLAMCLAGLLEYTWAALAPSLQPAHHWGLAPTFWLFSAVNYGSIYAWKALGGSFAGGGAALVMTGTLYGTAHFNWPLGFFFGAALGFLAMLTLVFLIKRPSEQEMAAAVRGHEEAQARKAKPKEVVA